MRLPIKFFLAALLAALAHAPAFCSGEIGIDVNTGLTYDQNNLEREISAINSKMMKYSMANPGTDMTPLNLPYSPVFGAGIRYSINSLMLRTGIIYARPFLYPSSGNIAPPSGSDNIVRFDSYAMTFPLQLCLFIPVNPGTSFFFGCGGAFHVSYLKITQSSPGQPGGPYVTPDSASLEYRASHTGWNFTAGAEAPLGGRATVTVELFYQSAASGRVRESAGASSRAMDSSCPMFLVGINYYLRLRG